MYYFNLFLLKRLEFLSESFFSKKPYWFILYHNVLTLQHNICYIFDSKLCINVVLVTQSTQRTQIAVDNLD